MISLGQRHGRATASELRRARRLSSLAQTWFATGRRGFPWREWRDSYRIAVAETLLQQTRAAAVEQVIGMVLTAYPDWASLRRAIPDELEEMLRPLGLHRRRSNTLRRLAAAMSSWDGAVWETLPGIGQYIGRAIRVFTEGSSEAMIDTNFARVVRRVFGGRWKADYRYDQRLQEIGAAITRVGDARNANLALLDIGALHCQARAPRCAGCPIIAECSFGLAHVRPLPSSPAKVGAQKVPRAPG